MARKKWSVTGSYQERATGKNVLNNILLSLIQSIFTSCQQLKVSAVNNIT